MEVGLLVIFLGLFLSFVPLGNFSVCVLVLMTMSFPY